MKLTAENKAFSIRLLRFSYHLLLNEKHNFHYHKNSPLNPSKPHEHDPQLWPYLCNLDHIIIRQSTPKCPKCNVKSEASGYVKHHILRTYVLLHTQKLFSEDTPVLRTLQQLWSYYWIMRENVSAEQTHRREETYHAFRSTYLQRLQWRLQQFTKI